MKEERNFKLREREKHKLRQIYKQEKCRQRDRQRYIIMNIRREGGKKKRLTSLCLLYFFFIFTKLVSGWGLHQCGWHHLTPTPLPSPTNFEQASMHMLSLERQHSLFPILSHPCIHSVLTIADVEQGRRFTQWAPSLLITVTPGQTWASRRYNSTLKGHV